MFSIKYFITVLFFLIIASGSGQVKFNDVNFNKIEQKKVREYLQMQQVNNIQSFLDIEPSVSHENIGKGYKVDERVYLLKDSLEKIWEHYLNTNPCDSWNAHRVSFGLLFSKREKKIVYKGDNIASLDTGQVIYLNLKLLQGISNLVTVIQFISIDEENKTIEFSYIDGNITKGKQQLQFFETSKGYTEIIHTSWFKSNSAFRDRFYPYFHTRLVNDFHKNMKRLYKLEHDM